MKSTQDIIDQIRRDEQVQIDRIRLNTSRALAAWMKVEYVEERFRSTLTTLGLEVATISGSKTGMSKDWEDGDSVHMSVTATPTNGKFRFIKDQGFDSQGRGKNQSRLNEKAIKLADQIKEGVGLKSVVVNPFSLEVKNAGDRGRVMIEFWVK